jgi:hypothetical protein
MSAPLSLLAATEAELRAFIDPAHMGYLPLYLARAEARYLLRESPTTVLSELARASRCHAAHGGVYLTKWAHNQFRKRRLEPLEVFLATADVDAEAGLRATFATDPLAFLAGLSDDDLQSEVAAVTPFFGRGACETPVEAAGAAAVFYWLQLSALALGDAEAWEVARRRAGTFHDDFGHLMGGASAGPVARLRTVHECLQVLHPSPPPNAAEVVGRTVARHLLLTAAEYAQTAARDPEGHAIGRGALDRTALALLALARTFGVDAADTLAAHGADPWWVDHARGLRAPVATDLSSGSAPGSSGEAP